MIHFEMNKISEQMFTRENIQVAKKKKKHSVIFNIICN